MSFHQLVNHCLAQHEIYISVTCSRNSVQLRLCDTCSALRVSHEQCFFLSLLLRADVFFARVEEARARTRCLLYHVRVENTLHDIRLIGSD